jgi:hypothetical protein
MRLVVTGGRDYCNTARIFAALDELHARKPVTVLIEGEARGVDVRAKAWARQRGIAFDPFPADWDNLGPAAGPIRNGWMIDLGKPDFALVFPGGTGTADMLGKVKAAGIPYEVVDA